ncbi:MAG: hypothetical protein AAGA30_12215 [Planctomycetota bacterium]
MIVVNHLQGQLVFSSGRFGRTDIWNLDLNTGEKSQITSSNSSNEKPCLSPDGRWITYTSNRTGFLEIYKACSNGIEEFQLTNLNRWCDSPRYSPDGSKIAFVSYESGNNEIWVMDSDGSNRKQMTESSATDAHIDWTPDGAGLVFSSKGSSGLSRICYFDLKSEVQTELVGSPYSDFNPICSPDGLFIAFVSNRNHDDNREHQADVWIMRSDGEKPVRLTESQACDASICWSPCGRMIMYVSQNDYSSCHLRLLDVSELMEAYLQNDEGAINTSASLLRNENLDKFRRELPQHSHCHTSVLPQFLPEQWVASNYPPGYFGLERFPHWVNPLPTHSCSAAAENSVAAM